MATATIVLSFLAVGLLSAHWPMILSGLHLEQNDLGDTLFNGYLFEHSYLWLTGDTLHHTLWSPPFFWPATNVGAYSDILLGTAPLYWIFRLWAPPDTAGQLWMLAASTLNFLTAFKVARSVGLKVLSSAAGAYLFAFCAPRVAHIGHEQLLPQFPSLIAIWAFCQLFREQASNRRYWLFSIVFATALTVQLYAGFYLGWFLVFGLTLVVFSIVAFDPQSTRRCVRKSWLPLGVSMALTILAVAPMFIHYRAAGQEVGSRSFDEVMLMVPRLGTWFQLGSVNWLYSHFQTPKWWPSAGPPAFQSEHRGGFGLLTTTLAVVGLFQGRSRTVNRVGISVMLAIVVVATMPPSGPITLWKLVWAAFPGAKAIRGVARISLLLSLPVALGLALFVDNWRRPQWVSLLLLSVCMIEQITRTGYFDKDQNRQQIASIAHLVDKDCEAFFYTPINPIGPYYQYQLQAMWASLEVKRPTVNGYSGNYPAGWIPENTITDQASETRISSYLDSWTTSRRVSKERVCWIRSPPLDRRE